MAGASAKIFTECGEGLFGEVFGEEGEERAAQERQIGQQVGLARTRAVFAHPDIPPPMIADFDPAPVAPDQLQPPRGRMFLGRATGQVITGLGAGAPRLFERPLAAQDDQGAGVGEVGLERFDGEGVEVADFDPPVAVPGLGKKGVSRKASSPWACLSRPGWLPLICSR